MNLALDPKTAASDYTAIKQRQQAVWASGDYGVIGTLLQIVGETLAEAIDLRADERVLDVAAGTGHMTLACARRFAQVTSTDYVEALLEKGRERVRADGLSASFKVADAENLPFEDDAFDVVVSTFGVMFAPDQERAAAEMLRVLRPGGRIGMANWTPESWIGTMFRIVSRYVPPPPHLQPPTRWGTATGLRELFGDGLADLAIEHRTFTFRYTSRDHWLDFFRTNFGPLITAYATLDPMAAQLLTDEIRDAAAAANRAKDGTFVVDSGYLEVVATRR